MEKGNRQVVLASKSPRRKDLLLSACADVMINSVDIDESFRDGESAKIYCQRLSFEKAQACYAHMQTELPILGADTIVVYEDHILGKPHNYEHGFEMLQQLSGKWHSVFTGWTILVQGKNWKGISETRVKFRTLQDQEIHGYLNTGEPFDKAGAYGIQGQGGALVDEISGSYTNVVGLPLSEVLQVLDTIVIGRE